MAVRGPAGMHQLAARVGGVPEAVTVGMAIAGMLVGVAALFLLMHDEVEPDGPYWTRTRVGGLVALLASGTVLAVGIFISSL